MATSIRGMAGWASQSYGILSVSALAVLRTEVHVDKLRQSQDSRVQPTNSAISRPAVLPGLRETRKLEFSRHHVAYICSSCSSRHHRIFLHDRCHTQLVRLCFWGRVGLSATWHRMFFGTFSNEVALLSVGESSCRSAQWPTDLMS